MTAEASLSVSMLEFPAVRLLADSGRELFLWSVKNMTIRTVNFQNYYVKYCKVNIIILISCNREWYHIITIKQMHYTVVLLF